MLFGGCVIFRWLDPVLLWSLQIMCSCKLSLFDVNCTYELVSKICQFFLYWYVCTSLSKGQEETIMWFDSKGFHSLWVSQETRQPSSCIYYSWIMMIHKGQPPEHKERDIWEYFLKEQRYMIFDPWVWPIHSFDEEFWGMMVFSFSCCCAMTTVLAHL